MSGSITLLNLRNEAKDRADMVNSGLVSDSMWNKYINKSKDALYDMLISAYDDEYFAKTSTFTIVPGTSNYSLPTDFYKLLHLEIVNSPTQRKTMRKFQFKNKNRYSYPSTIYGYDVSKYRIVGSNLVLYPVPSSGQTLEMWYIPLATNLVADGDELNGFNGFEEYIILDAAIKACRKEETDTQDLERDRMIITDRIERMRHNRDAAEKARIIEVEEIDLYDDFLN